jgi:hypothetical protein
VSQSFPSDAESRWRRRDDDLQSSQPALDMAVPRGDDILMHKASLWHVTVMSRCRGCVPFQPQPRYRRHILISEYIAAAAI